uniref:rRNA N-glycosidase n=1 Tax=Oryza brachyantha TaxID=4533 RepID=J3MWB5_ORYBR
MFINKHGTRQDGQVNIFLQYYLIWLSAYVKSPLQTNRAASNLVYNVDAAGGYEAFMTAFRTLLGEHPNRKEVEGHHVLARQRARQPARWIHVKLVAGEETTTLAIRDDNVYLKGFMNKEGEWYELSGPTERSARMLPPEYASSLLGCCDVGYRSILGADVDEKVLDMLTHATVLETSFTIEAVRRLSGYRPHATDYVDPFVRLSLVRLIILVCESARIRKLYDTISSGLGSALTTWQVHYLWNWKRMSRLLLQSSQGNSSDIWPRRDPQLEPLGITSARETLRIVDLLLNCPLPPARVPDTDSLGDGLGRQRVELLAVRADFPRQLDAITVFDGKRGQVIYRRQQAADDHSSVLDYQEKGKRWNEPWEALEKWAYRIAYTKRGNMMLTGPYRSISADGCFAIQVDVAGSGVFFWEWDGYDKTYASQVNSAIPSYHTIDIGLGRAIHVAYAVMSNAVETDVQVELPLAGGTLVSGHVTARIEGFGTMGSVLFSATTAVPISTVDSTVPLARSVVALQYGKRLYIQVKLRADTNEGVKDFEDTVITLGGRSSVEQLRTRHGTVLVNIVPHPKLRATRGCV